MIIKYIIYITWLFIYSPLSKLRVISNNLIVNIKKTKKVYTLKILV